MSKKNDNPNGNAPSPLDDVVAFLRDYGEETPDGRVWHFRDPSHLTLRTANRGDIRIESLRCVTDDVTFVTFDGDALPLQGMKYDPAIVGKLHQILLSSARKLHAKKNEPFVASDDDWDDVYQKPGDEW